LQQWEENDIEYFSNYLKKIQPYLPKKLFYFLEKIGLHDGVGRCPNRSCRF